MSARIVRTATIAVLALCSSNAWGQYEQPRQGTAPQPRRNAAPRSGAREQFQFSQEDDLPATPPADRAAPRRAGEIRPVAGQSPIRQPGNGQGNRPPANGPIVNDPAAIIPCPWEPLAANEQRALDNLMKAWEQHSSQIERYSCKFQRWQYDPTAPGGSKDPAVARTYAEGRLLYAAPDKGLFEVQSMKTRVPDSKPEDEVWRDRAVDDIGEHWVCDGKRIFTFDARAKKLVEQELPPQMHGKAIVDGPLPFLFGAKVAKIEARYWLRLITPHNVNGEQWIEASPKHAADAQNFKMIHVIIDEKDFLPMAIQVFNPRFDPEKTPIRDVYRFNDREYNWNTTLQKLNLFHREFYEPATPLGWTKMVESFRPEPGQQPAAEKTPTANKPNPLKLPFRFR
jgi:TIGR03009 family protein